MCRYLLILFKSEYRLLLCNRGPTFNTSAHVLSRGMQVVNCRFVYIIFHCRLAPDVCLFVTGTLLVLLLFESANRFAATIDGLVMH